MSLYRAEQKRMWEAGHSRGATLDRKVWPALLLYGVLAALAWFTIGGGSIRIRGNAVEVRLIPLILLGGFALRTILAWYADRIRRNSEEQ